MPKFFFDVHDGFETKDDIGQELESLGWARNKAVQIAADFVKDIGKVTSVGTIVVAVRDEAGIVVTTVRLVCQVD